MRLLSAQATLLLEVVMSLGLFAYGNASEEPVCAGEMRGCAAEEQSAGKHTHYLAACTVFRDEDRFLREWLSFHLCVGFEHFYLYADRPFDDCHTELLQPYVDAGLVTLAGAVAVRNPQIPTYDLCLHDHRLDARWLAFIDVDEFLHPANASMVLRDVLERYEDVGGLVVPWTLFGSAQHVAAPQGLVIENFQWRRRLPECNGDTCAYKVIAQSRFTERCDVHNHYYSEEHYAVNEAGRRMHDDASLLPMESFPGDFPTDVIRLFHYKTKSLADSLWKLKRKEGVNAEGIEALNPSTLEGQLRWFASSDYNQILDQSILRYSRCVHRSLAHSLRHLSARARACEQADIPTPGAVEGSIPSLHRHTSPPSHTLSHTPARRDTNASKGEATIVTAYYQVESKFGPKAYEEWMRNLLLYVASPILVFTDARGEGMLTELARQRPHWSRRIEVVELREFLVWRRYEKAWEQQRQLDEEEAAAGHSHHLYMIWNEKTNWLLRVAQENPFSSEMFLWVDIGVFRNSSDMKRFNRWPSPKKLLQLPPDKITILQVEGFSVEEEEMAPGEEWLGVDFYYVNRLGGGIFGGTREAVEAWHTAYYHMLHRYMEQGRFAGKDQSVMASVCLYKHALCHLIRPPAHWKLTSKTQTTENPWFYMQDFLV